MSKFGFDLSEYHTEDRNYDPIPMGDYFLKCTDAVVKPTRTGGEMIAAAFEVVGGDFNGRKLWNNFNIHNNSEVAQRIGREQVSAWAKAAGKPNANSFDELLERKFKAIVDIEKGKDGYADKNRIAGYIMPSSSAPAAPAAAKAKAPVGGIEDMESDELPAAKPSSGGKKKNPWD